MSCDDFKLICYGYRWGFICWIFNNGRNESVICLAWFLGFLWCKILLMYTEKHGKILDIVEKIIILLIPEVMSLNKVFLRK